MSLIVLELHERLVPGNGLVGNDEGGRSGDVRLKFVTVFNQDQLVEVGRDRNVVGADYLKKAIKNSIVVDTNR